MTHRTQFILLLFLLATVVVQAQQTFQVALPGLENAFKRPATQTSDGGTCVLGTLRDLGRIDYRMILTKLAPDGRIEWARQILTSGRNENGVGVRCAPNGDIIVLGVTSKPGSLDQDILVVRLRKDGTLRWSKSYDYGPVDWVNDFSLSDDGSVVIAGATQAPDSVLTYDPSYEGYQSDGRALAFKIDSAGKVLWGWYMKDVVADKGSILQRESYVQGVCVGRNGSATMAAHIKHGKEAWSTIIVQTTSLGTAGQGLWIPGAEENGMVIYAPFVNDLTPLPNGDVLLGGVGQFYVPTPNFRMNVSHNQGFLLRLAPEQRILWHRTYDFTPRNPLPMSVALLDEQHYLIAGRALFSEAALGSSEARNLYDLDNPVMAITDTVGNPVIAREWKTTFEALPLPEAYETKNHPYFAWSIFNTAADKGIMAVGTLRKPAPTFKWGSSLLGLLVARFDSDMETCGGNSTEQATIRSDSATSLFPPTRFSYYSMSTPSDANPYDMRIDEREGEEEPKKREEPAIDEIGIAEITAPLEPIAPQIESETTSKRTTPSLPVEEPETEPEILPIIPISLTLAPITIKGKNRPDLNVSTIEIRPYYFCGGERANTASVASEEKEPIQNFQFLYLLPNTVARKKKVEVKFLFIGTNLEYPTIEVFRANGKNVALRIRPEDIVWDQESGFGSGVISTSNLSKGTYTVRVQSGKSRLTATLEVR